LRREVDHHRAKRRPDQRVLIEGSAKGRAELASAQWDRGNVQYDTYLYSGGFSFTSTVCALASVAVIPSTAKPATPIITLHTDLFMQTLLPID
jgi:hypothetical protein